MDIFRFMGMPDKVLAIEGLPEDFLRHFEMIRADGFPRHWKEFMGKRKKITPIPPEKDLLTGAVRRFDPIVEEDSFFFVVDWNLKQNEEKWQELTDYIRKNVNPDTRLLDKIEDMAKPLARDKSESVSLEPEDVPMIVIPKPQEILKPIAEQPPVSSIIPATAVEKPKKEPLRCTEPGCLRTFQGSWAKNSLRFHIDKSHRKHPAIA